MIFTQNDFSGGGFNSLTSTLRLLCLTRFVDRSFLVCDYLFVKNPVAPEAPLPQGYLAALARYSFTRSTTISHPDHSDRFLLCFRHIP